MTDTYDAIVVGARCAGAPTAMLLARRGYRVLLVDRATFPSDTLSTHVIHAPGVAALRRWGLLDTVVATGCPPIEKYTFDFGPFTIAGTPHPCEGITTAYAPRRILLDKILVDAAAAAGVEVRERFSVEDVVVADGTVVGIRGRDEHGSTVTEHARLVIGADGRYSHVARWVGAELYNSKPMLQHAYYTYFSDLPVAGFETVARPDRGWGAAPTNDGLTMVVVGWPYAERDAYRADIEGNFFATLELAPEFAARVRAARRAEPLRRRLGRELLPQAVRAGLGAGRRRRIHQGPDHRAGHQRRLPRRGAVQPRRRRMAVRRTVLRRRDVGLPARPGTLGCCRSTSSPPSSPRSSRRLRPWRRCWAR